MQVKIEILFHKKVAALLTSLLESHLLTYNLKILN